jgi:predicted  nucleic acid-binding Zn-ribbon protein
MKDGSSFYVPGPDKRIDQVEEMTKEFTELKDEVETLRYQLREISDEFKNFRKQFE